MSLEILRGNNLVSVLSVCQTTGSVSSVYYLLETELLLSLKSHDGTVIP